MLLIATALLLGQDPPRTVNDGVLGKAEDFATAGPAVVCVGTTAVSVETGERAYLQYLGIHHGSVRIKGPTGYFDVDDGDSWAEPKERYDRVRLGGHNPVLRFWTKSKVRYLIYSGGQEPKPSIWVEGTSLNGGVRDLSILRRINIALPDLSKCSRRFEYGWGFILGDEEGK